MRIAVSSVLLVLFLVPWTCLQAQETAAPAATTAHSAVQVEELRKRAMGGEARAQVEVARAYEEGQGVEQNDEMAVTWLRAAAEQGDAAGENELGLMYQMGRGVPKDLEQAVSWYRSEERRVGKECRL